MKSLFAGSIAGFLATVPMTLTMSLLHRLSPPPHHWRSVPPRKVAMELAAKVGFKKYLGEPHRKLVSTASHFGYGAAAGAVYGRIADRVPQKSAVLNGALFGFGVWAVSYLGWLPLARIWKPAKEPSERNLTMIASHLVWGATLGAITKNLVSR